MDSVAAVLPLAALAIGVGIARWRKSRRVHAPELEDLRMDLADLPTPPSDPHDAAGWDRYWEQDLTLGGMVTGFNDMMASDETLPRKMAARGVQSVLCVGNGLSAEAGVLANLGFSVTALDRSELATRLATNRQLLSEHPMHRTEGLATRPPGTVTFVVGDLFDPGTCPGPFDAVIERRTLQLFSPADQIRAFEALVSRLAPYGMLVSHVHMGCWRPGESREHFAKKWLEGLGFSEEPKAERLAVLWVTSG